MSPRSLFFVPLLASGLLAAPIAADRLLVAGPDGLVMQADTDQGVFEYFACQCSGPIKALAVDGQRLYTADDLSQLSVFDVETGAPLAFFTLGIGQISALAATGGKVFVGTEDGLVAGIDPVTGDVLDWRMVITGGSATAVTALLAHSGFLYVGGADGAVYRAPAAQGDFQYFTCFCFSYIVSMAMVEGDLVIGDASGIVARASARTGLVHTAFFVGPTNTMVASDGALLLYYDGGVIPLVDDSTGQPLPGGFLSPIDVDAMLVIPDPSVAPRVRTRAGQGPTPPAGVTRNP